MQNLFIFQLLSFPTTEFAIKLLSALKKKVIVTHEEYGGVVVYSHFS
jgi:hypothetical protein